MEVDANWILSEAGGGEFASCCISATLRDYGHIGLFALGNGRLPDGTQVLPDKWMAESTSSSKGYAGYGHLWWIHIGGAFRATGLFGQSIYVDPQENVVIALHSARAVDSKHKGSDWALEFVLYASLTEALRDQPRHASCPGLDRLNAKW